MNKITILIIIILINCTAVSKGKKSVAMLNPDGNSKRYLLSAGINDYADVGLSSLKKARNDAKGFGKVLRERGDFDYVFTMTDDLEYKSSEKLFPTRLNILEKWNSILNFANPDDLLVFFFSGHGASSDRESYLIPYDTVIGNISDTGLRLSDLLDRLQRRGIKRAVFFLDASRDNMRRSKGINWKNENLNFSDAEGISIYYASSEGEHSYEDDDSNYSVFTRYLLESMEKGDSNGDGRISFRELSSYTSAKVADWSLRKEKKQNPAVRAHTEMYGEIFLVRTP